MNEDKHNMDAKGFKFSRFRKVPFTRHDLHRPGVYTIQEEEVSDEEEQETQEKACSKEEQEEPVESE